MKMQGAAREKGDLTHTPKYRAGEKGVEGGSKNQRGCCDAAGNSGGAHAWKQETKDVSHHDGDTPFHV